MSLLPKTFFLQVRLLFSTWHFFFCQLNDTICRVGAWVGCQGFFAGCGGPERTPKHQRVKESEAEGGVVKRGSKGHKLTSSVQMSTLVGLTKFFNILQHNHLSRRPEFFWGPIRTVTAIFFSTTGPTFFLPVLVPVLSCSGSPARGDPVS